jgi:hypothetical protein
MGSFVPRLVALTVVWLLATAALTYAAAQRMATPRVVPATTTAARAVTPQVKVVPDVRRQAFVFAKGTLGDDGFGWRVEGSVRGFNSNTVVSQSPAAGTRVLDTGAPRIVLRLVHGAGKEAGLPEDVSTPGTPVKLADLAVAPVTPAVHVKAAPRHAKAPAAKKIAPAKKKIAPAKKIAPKQPVKPIDRRPQSRPPAFTVAGARREPLNEMPLAVRAKLLLDWLQTDPRPTDANVGRWLYQHAWIVSGARMGWWHGEAALQTLVAADNRAWALWGIGARSRAVARQALVEVAGKSR